MNDRGIGVLEQYDFEVRNIYKGRGTLILDTDQGLKTFREFTGSGKKLAFQAEVQGQLKAAGLKSDFIVENREGALVSADKDESVYIVREWYEARECNIRDEGEICAAAENLARLHGLLEGLLEEDESGMKSYRQDERALLLKHNREMRKTRSYMRNRQGKTDFEIFFLRYYPEFSDKALSACQEEYFVAYERLFLEASAAGAVCHGSYNQHNVMFAKGRIITLDFERCHIGVQLADLYDFMRKVLEKWDWDVRLGQKLLERYSRVRQIGEEGRQYLVWRFSYPEKFWKIANHYYNSRKSWIPDKNMEKLRMLIRQEKKKEDFLLSLR